MISKQLDKNEKIYQFYMILYRFCWAQSAFTWRKSAESKLRHLGLPVTELGIELCGLCDWVHFLNQWNLKIKQFSSFFLQINEQPIKEDLITNRFMQRAWSLVRFRGRYECLNSEVGLLGVLVWARKQELFMIFFQTDWTAKWRRVF